MKREKVHRRETEPDNVRKKSIQWDQGPPAPEILTRKGRRKWDSGGARLSLLRRGIRMQGQLGKGGCFLEGRGCRIKEGSWGLLY